MSINSGVLGCNFQAAFDRAVTAKSADDSPGSENANVPTGTRHEFLSVFLTANPKSYFNLLICLAVKYTIMRMRHNETATRPHTKDFLEHF